MKSTIEDLNKENITHYIDNEISTLSSGLRLSKFIKIEMVKTELINKSILHFQLKLYDSEPLPITLDVIKNIFSIPTKTVYMLPGSALNFESNFLTPKDNNLAIFIANKQQSVVIGITPREDNSPLNFNYSLMKDWNLEYHTNDVDKVIRSIQTVIPNNYEIVGHSAGAVRTLNYASKTNDNRLRALRIIDIVGQYPQNSQEFINAQMSRDATETIISEGIVVDTSFINFKQLALAAIANPSGDSGVPRYSFPGNFTLEGLLYFSLIHTNQLPGLITPITGLPDNWTFKQGFLTGTYEFDTTSSDGLNDKYSLTNTSISTVFSSLEKINSGVYPLSEQKDFYALWSNLYPLEWENIRIPVHWIDTELGFGDYSEISVSLLENSEVTYKTIGNYGHADSVFSRTAENDFWKVLFS